MSALPVSELGEREARRVSVRASVGFVAGFTILFTALGVGAAVAGSAVLRHQATMVRGFGVVIIVLGLSNPDGNISVAWGVSGVPESFLVDPGGIVRAKVLGGVTEAGLNDLLAEASGGSR